MTNPWSELRNGVPTHLALKPLRFPSYPIRLVQATEHDSLVEAAHENTYACSTM